MKKAIRAVIAVLAVCLLAVSCTKTASNTLAVMGNWKLIRTDITTGGHTETVYPTDVITYLEFHSGDAYVWTTVTLGGSTVETGRWYVDDDILTLTLPSGGHRVFRIEGTGFSRLVLSETITENGVTTIYRDTYKYVVLEN
jgi:hypothetical protein